MKVRLTTPFRDRGRYATAAATVAGALLMAVMVSACTGGPSTPTVFTPQPTAQAQSSPRQSGSAGQPAASAGATTARVPSSPGKTQAASQGASSAAAPGPAGPTATAGNPSAAAPTGAPASQYPTGAPETGGGGTAGLQDGTLLGFGGASILAGLAILAYRRRLTRSR